MNWITQFQIGRNKMCVCMCVCVYSQKRTNDIENFRNEIMPNKIDIISTIVSSYYYFQHIFGCCCRCRRPAHSYPSTLFVFFSVAVSLVLCIVDILKRKHPFGMKEKEPNAHILFRLLLCWCCCSLSICSIFRWINLFV